MFFPKLNLKGQGTEIIFSRLIPPYWWFYAWK